MPAPFVWFDNIGPERSATTDFLSKNFGWNTNDIGPLTFLMEDGAEMPFAGTADPGHGISGWLPYIEVQDLAAEAAKARDNGAEIVAENLDGPAGQATIIRDPGGAPLALWKRAQG